MARRLHRGRRIRRGVLSYSCPVPEPLGLVLVVPDYALPTEEARKVLPDKYSRADAVHNLQRAAVLTAQLFSGKAEFRNTGFFDDRWHQPFRSHLVRCLPEVLALVLFLTCSASV